MSAKERILILFGADSALEWGRSFQLAKAFRKLGHEVMYIDLPLPISQTLRMRNSGAAGSGAEFPIFRPKFGLPYGRMGWLRGINRKIIIDQIRASLCKEQFIPTILWVYSPYDPKIAGALIGELKPRRVVYDCADERVSFAELRGGKKAGIKVKSLENELMRLCDTVVTVTDNLREVKSEMHNNVVVIPNGIDSDMFSMERIYPLPKEYKELKSPRCLLTGSVEHWVDLDLMAECALRYPGYTFIVIGPVGVDTSGLKSYVNILFLGSRPYRDMPAYIQHADLCLIPFKRTGMIKYSNTLKALQYLCMNKPTLSTEYEGINNYQGLITVAVSNKDFVDKIQQILDSKEKNSSAQLMREILKNYSWQNVARKALQAIEL